MSNYRLKQIVIACVIPLIGLAFGSAANGDVVNPIHLEWRSAEQTVLVGATVDVGLYAVYENVGGDSNGWISAMDVILDWDSSFLELTGVNNNGPYDWLSSSFPNDSSLDGLNDTWLDGDAFYSASSQFFGGQALATPDGLLVTTVQFTALAETEGTDLTIPADFGVYTHSQVIDGEVAGWLVQGDLGSATITIVPEPTALGFIVLPLIVGLARRRQR